MHELGLFAMKRKPRKYNSYKGQFNGTVPNLLMKEKKIEYTDKRSRHVVYYRKVRDFDTKGVNEKWCSDVSQANLPFGKTYISPIMDLHTREIVAINISASPDFRQVTDMLSEAFKKNPNVQGLIFHTDQGWQYQMEAFHKMLKAKGVRQSMSRRGNCHDNSIMENFFGLLKNEMLYGHENEFKNLEEFRKAVLAYVEYYNTKRIKKILGWKSPLEYRQSLAN